MKSSIRILLIDDDEDEYILLKGMFSDLPGQVRQAGRYVLDWARGYDDALAKCLQNRYDIYLVDYYLGKDTGLQVMNALRENGCNAPFILLTGQGSYELDLTAMQHGVSDYLLKDQINEYLLERSIRYALERQSIQDELERLVQERTAELSQSEARFRSLANTTSAAIFILQDQVIRYANPAALFVTGYPPADLEGTELWRLAHPAYQDALRHGNLSGWVQGLPLRYEVKIIHREGEERWLDITAGYIPAGQSQYDGREALLLTAFDITERDRAERELRQMKENLEGLVAERTEAARASEAEAHQRAEELDGLQRATSALLSTLELEAMFVQILSAAQSAIPQAEKGLLCLVGANGELQEPSAMLGYEGEKNGSLPACLSAAVCERQPVMKVEGDDNCPVEGSWIASPLVVEDQVLGALALGSGQVEAFRPANLRLLSSFAAAATTALQNAVLHGEMKLLAESDPLTGKYNRRAFFELGEAALAKARRAGQPFSAILIDLDDFKEINDSLGHDAGDRVLREVADHCRSHIRETDLFGRYGGDEFAILLPGMTLEKAAVIAERILELTAQIDIGDPSAGSRGVSISLGVAGDQPGMSGLSNLILEADRALLSAKRQGKGRLLVAPEKGGA